MPGIADEQTFVTDFAARLEAKQAATETASGATNDTKGSASTQASTETTTESKATDTAATDTPVKKIASSDGSATDPDDTGTETTAEETGTGTEKEKDADAAKEKEVEEDPAEKAEKDKEADDDPDEDPASDVDDSARVAEFQALLKKNGLKATLEELPTEVRAIAKATLDNMQSAFTRTQMEATQFRKERATFEAENRFRAEHPELSIAEMLKGKPELIEKVQAELDKLEDPDKAKLFDITVRDSRKDALDKVSAEVAQLDRVMARGDEIETYTRRACANLNLPFEAVINAVIVAIYGKPDDARDLSEQELDAVISKQQRILKRHPVAVVREDRKRAIVDRAKDRKTTTPAVKVGAGAHSPTPTPKAVPKNDEEFAAHMAAKHGR